MTPIGYIVLTQQPDGSWRDDWDGAMHATINDGCVALAAAQRSCIARLVACVPVIDDFGDAA